MSEPSGMAIFNKQKNTGSQKQYLKITGEKLKLAGKFRTADTHSPVSPPLWQAVEQKQTRDAGIERQRQKTGRNIKPKAEQRKFFCLCLLSARGLVQPVCVIGTYEVTSRVSLRPLNKCTDKIFERANVT